MRAAKTAATGSSGTTEVKAKFERLGQGPIEVPQEHDLGIDLLVQVRDDRGFDAGLLFGVQVKSGSASAPSTYFKEPDKSPDGPVTGWWHRETESKHFDSWIRHGLAVILVLYDLDTCTAHWVQVTPDKVQSTGMGYKIRVPANQVINEDQLPAILKIAATKRTPVSWEGSAWDGAAIAPGDRLRHALLVPRLVAPHRNTGFSRVIGPEEGLALLAQARFADLDHFASRHATVPSLTDAAQHEAWKWRFVAAYGALLSEGQSSAVTGLVSSARGPAERTAAVVVSACALVEDEQYTQALELLSTEIERDQAEPVDHAWLLVQRARVRSELADDQGAADDVAQARIAVLLAPQDSTTSAVAAAAAESIFRAARWGAGDLEAFITASDTAASWWRTQHLGSAYQYATDRSFDHWTQSGTVYLTQGRAAYNELEAARWTASLSGHLGSWRAYTSLLGRQVLLDTEQEESPDEHVGNALQLLRVSGDASALTKAVERLNNIGPVAPVVHTVQSVLPGPWSERTFRANLELWEHAGDLLDAPAADTATDYCLSLLAGSTPIATSISDTTKVAYYALRALRGLLNAATTASHIKVRDMLVTRSPWPTLESAAGLIFCLSDALFRDPADRALWRTAALRHIAPHENTGTFMLGRIAQVDEEARAVLIARVDAGSFMALDAVGSATALGTDVGRRAIQRAGQEVRTILTNLAGGARAMRSTDLARALAMLNIAYPEHAEWAPIIDLLRQPGASGNDKRGVCFYLTANIEQVPQSVCGDLASAVGHTATSSAPPPPVPQGFTEVGGAEAWLATALGVLDAEQQAGWRARLLTGSPQERADAVVLAHLAPRPQDTAVLLALLSDPHHTVRIQAAYEIAYRANGEVPDSEACAGLGRAVRDPSTAVPLILAQTLADDPARNQAVEEARDVLKDHPSVKVRRLLVP